MASVRNDFFKWNKTSSGFTAVELLVAIMLTGLVVGFGYKGYLFFEKSFMSWQNRIQLEEEGRRTMQAITNELRTVRRFTNTGQSSLSFIDSDRQHARLGLDGRSIFKNNVRLTSTQTIVDKLRFQYLGDEGKAANLYSDGQDIRTIEIALTLSNPGGMRFELLSSVTLRNRRSF